MLIALQIDYPHLVVISNASECFFRFVKILTKIFAANIYKKFSPIRYFNDLDCLDWVTSCARQTGSDKLTK